MRASRSIALAATALAVLGLGVGSALADPASTPPDASIVAVGSDTLTPLYDQFSADYNATSPTLPLYSFDATGTSPIQPKQDSACADITRPNGSSAGISAVSTSPSFTDSGGVSGNCMDIARASRQLVATDPVNMAQDVIAQDLITYSTTTAEGATSNVPSNLTFLDLKAIFNCNASLISSSFPDAPVTENEIGGVGTDTVVAVIPQSGSGTRSSWATDLGFSNSNPPSCVVNGTFQGTGIEENEGTNAIFTSSEAPDIVFPYSAGDYVCFNDTGKCGEAFDSAVLALNEIQGTAPLTGTAPNQTINVKGFFPIFVRNLNSDFVTNDVSPFVPAYLQPLLGSGKGTGWVCTNSTAQKDITSFGFADTTNCGTITLTPGAP